MALATLITRTIRSVWQNAIDKEMRRSFITLSQSSALSEDGDACAWCNALLESTPYWIHGSATDVVSNLSRKPATKHSKGQHDFQHVVIKFQSMEVCRWRWSKHDARRSLCERELQRRTLLTISRFRQQTGVIKGTSWLATLSRSVSA